MMKATNPRLREQSGLEETLKTTLKTPMFQLPSQHFPPEHIAPSS